jgi:peptide/nickel transport system substrate-binding protein
MRGGIRLTVAAAVICLSLVAAGCGGGKKEKTTATSAPTAAKGGKKGGTMTLLVNGDVDDKLDPGYSYYQLDFIYNYLVERPVISYKPTDTTQPSPDLAASYPTVSPDGKTVTIKLKQGIKFAPPVSREITSADVKYAIERDFLPQVGNGYAGAYWGDLEGLDAYKSGKAKEISGLQTPDKFTLIMKLTRPTGAVAVAALALPGSAPVPKEYAQKYDAGKQSTYGQWVVASGPYMVQNDPKTGKITGYQPGKQITFVRNPNWDPKTDFRPAYLDKVIFKEGLDPAVGNRQAIQGSGLVGNPTDLAPPPAFIKANVNKPDNMIPGFYSGRVRYIALNTQTKPFDNINLRKAVAASINRSSMLLAFGGPFVGAVATHILTPGELGFDQAGGMQGEGNDWLANPQGDAQVAAKYMKAAGYPSGKYSGPAITMVADNSTNQKNAAEVVLAGLKSLGFKVNFRPVTRDTMYSKYCSVPKNEPQVCPSVGWLKDFPDPQSMLDPTFNGKNIVPTNNSNWAQLNDAPVNKAITAAEVLIDPAQRAKAWAEVDNMVIKTAAVVPWMWDKPPLVKSSDVNAVVNKANAAIDFNFSSLK